MSLGVLHAPLPPPILPSEMFQETDSKLAVIFNAIILRDS